ncbi:hypothetical protein JI435_401740 [Parastagonospora nodorum SN15]|uniref:Uncharacterized protein n=1 Tax=Phaeosphaeria nodorum (strain SN15 / ATCC MYA-4574 / FGSC 10173) TaxID=321614 RepID=A0A7U2ERM6_PHANO|nr:hypothetical protein JI435_401740 [Parastagonospora nodorum SN15]
MPEGCCCRCVGRRRRLRSTCTPQPERKKVRASSRNANDLPSFALTRREQFEPGEPPFCCRCPLHR